MANIEIVRFSEDAAFYYPPKSLIDGLETLVMFPDGDIKQTGIPNSTVWVYTHEGHNYVAGILSGDIGCGMAVYPIQDVNPRGASDKIFKRYEGSRVIGGGNHFIDICSGFKDQDPHKVLIVHTHGGPQEIQDGSVTSVEQAIRIQEGVAKQRLKLCEEIAELLGVSGQLLGDYSHNTVEVIDRHVIYRKGVIKVQAGKLTLLPKSPGDKILFYTVNSSNMPPYDSMPHATGRTGPRGETKVSIEKARELRNRVYIPRGISDASLTSCHPDCFNDFDKIFGPLGKYIVTVDELKILGYIAKL